MPDAMVFRAVLSFVAVGLVLCHGLGAERGGRLRLLWRGALGTACLLGVLNYYRFDSRQLLQVGDYYDVTYYYLNTKYFDELGYFELYRAMLLADAARAPGARRLEHIRTVRDLRDYDNRPRAELMRGAESVRTRFSAARFAAFAADADFLAAQQSPGKLAYFFKDHGYNGTPTWSWLVSALSRSVDVQHLKWITSLDLLLLLGMFVVLWRSFGADTALVALLFFCCTHSGRWPVAGQALLRFDWLVALVTGYCAWTRGRALLAGVLIAYATQSRLFPALYLVPPGLVWLALSLRTRSLPREGLRVAIGFGASLALVSGAALARHGAGAFVDAATNLAMHAGADSYSSLRVGLADALVFRGERYWPLLGEAGGIPGKAAQVASLHGLTRALALLVCGLLSWHAFVRRPTAASVLPLGGLLLFALFTPQINYMNARLLWVPWHMAAPGRPRNALGLGLLFGIEVAANAAPSFGAIDYAVTSISSVGLLLHAAVVCLSLARECVAGAEPAPWPRSRVLGVAVAGLCGWALVVAAYFQAGARPAPTQSVALTALQSDPGEGARFDAPGARVLDASGLRVELGQPRNDTELELLHDHDDHYDLLFERDGQVVGRAALGRRGRGRPRRLVESRVRVPARVVGAGYDAILVLPREGDRRFSVAHVRLR